MNKNGILLEVLQVLSDLDLHIFKAYITSDGGWFMDGKIKMMPPSPVVISAAAHLVQRPYCLTQCFMSWISKDRRLLMTRPSSTLRRLVNSCNTFLALNF
jgi:hypothetical protein